MRTGPDACPPCHGSGAKVYSSGATWRGGAGTTSYQRDVCDTCWGSGDAQSPNANLRDELAELHAALNSKGAAASGAWLAGKLGLEYETVRRELPAVTKKLRAMRGLGFWSASLCDRLANALEELAG